MFGSRATAAQPLALSTAITLSVPSNGVSTTPDGRTFLVLARIDGSSGPRVVEWQDGKVSPYPNAEWNDWSEGKDPAKHLVRVNSQRIGPDGSLWLVDVGAPGIGRDLLPGGPKLVQIDVASDAVTRVYSLDQAVTPTSFIDDVRFHARRAFLTDAGSPGLIILDLDTGAQRRVLQNHASVTARLPISAEGKTVAIDGKSVFIHADQLEVSPDGQFLYFQPCSGPLYRIETRYLEDGSLSDDALGAHITEFAKTPSTGGTAIDAAGNIYVSDTNELRIIKITSGGEVSVLLQDPRLLWVDAMWIDNKQRLWLPAAQLNRLAVFQNGVDKVEYPVHIYTVQLEFGPSPIDHA